MAPFRAGSSPSRAPRRAARSAKTDHEVALVAAVGRIVVAVVAGLVLWLQDAVAAARAKGAGRLAHAIGTGVEAVIALLVIGLDHAVATARAEAAAVRRARV